MFVEKLIVLISCKNRVIRYLDVDILAAVQQMNQNVAHVWKLSASKRWTKESRQNINQMISVQYATAHLLVKNHVLLLDANMFFTLDV